jgi:hypothetical protein
MVLVAEAVVDENAVVVELLDTTVAEVTMVGIFRP